MGLFDKLRGKKSGGDNSADASVTDIGGAMEKAYNPYFSIANDNAAFFFVRLPLDEAERRYKALDLPGKKTLNVEEGIEFGVVGQWVVFADYLPDYNELFTGGFGSYDGDFPIFFGMVEKEEAIFAMYETDNCSGNLYAMKDGEIIRDFVSGFDEEYDRNIGQLHYEQERTEDWVDITALISVLLGK